MRRKKYKKKKKTDAKKPLLRRVRESSHRSRGGHTSYYRLDSGRKSSAIARPSGAGPRAETTTATNVKNRNSLNRRNYCCDACEGDGGCGLAHFIYYYYYSQ